MNNVVLVGRLTKDVEVKKTNNGTSVAVFTVAVQRMKKDETDFIGVQAWNATADFLGRYGKKGNLVAVKGSIRTETFENQNGKQYITRVNAENVDLLTWKGEGDD